MRILLCMTHGALDHRNLHYRRTAPIRKYASVKQHSAYERFHCNPLYVLMLLSPFKA